MPRQSNKTTSDKSYKTTGYPTRRRRVYASAPRKPVGKPSRPQPRDRAPGYISTGGEVMGTALGALIPVPGAPLVGKFLGGKIGHLIEKITGFGDYRVKNNTIMSGGMSHPQIVNSVEGGGVIIRFREYIADITATKAFFNRTYIIQPGQSDTFPWLSSMANSFEQYQLRGVLFEFNSTSSDSILATNTSSALGSVIMSTDYDIADEPPTSKRQMLNTLFSSSEKPSVSFIHPIECKKSLSAQSILYTRHSGVPEGFDPRLYDFARFNLATEGMQADGGVLGELWVTYEIELFKQQTSFAGLIDHIYFNTATTSRPLGTVSNPTGNFKRGATLGGTILADGRTYAFPPQVSSGKYFISYSVTGVSAASVIPASISSTLNCTQINFFANGLANFVASPNPAATSNCCMRNIVVQVTGQNASILWNNSDGNPPAAPNGDFWVMRIPDVLTSLPS